MTLPPQVRTAAMFALDAAKLVAEVVGVLAYIAGCTWAAWWLAAAGHAAWLVPFVVLAAAVLLGVFAAVHWRSEQQLETQWRADHDEPAPGRHRRAPETLGDRVRIVCRFTGGAGHKEAGW